MDIVYETYYAVLKLICLWLNIQQGVALQY